MKATSIGAAVVGALGALPALGFAQEQTPGAALNTATSAATTPMLQVPVTGPAAGTLATPFTVFVNGSTSDGAFIYIGEQAIPLKDASVVQYLRQLAASA